MRGEIWRRSLNIIIIGRKENRDSKLVSLKLFETNGGKSLKINLSIFHYFHLSNLYLNVYARMATQLQFSNYRRFKEFPGKFSTKKFVEIYEYSTIFSRIF